MKTLFPIVTTALLGVSLASAAVVEDFNYTSNTTLSSSQTGGAGWSGGYYADTVLTTSPTNFNVVDYTWTTPTFANTSGTYTIVDKKAKRLVAGTSSDLAYRGLSTSINFDADGTHYFSYMLDSTSGIGQELNFFDGASEILSVQYLGGSDVLRLRSTDTTNSLTIGATAGNDWFVLGKIETSASGSDVFRLSVFETGDTVAATEGSWDLSLNGGTITGAVDVIGLGKHFDAAVGIGNLRMDSTYAGVTSVIPEPSSLLLLGTALGAFVLFNRRRVK